MNATNMTNTTSIDSNNLKPVYIVGLCLAAVVTGFHCCAIYASIKSKELKKVRFLRLALFLSLSDCAIGIEFMYGILLNFFKNGEKAINLQCMLFRDIVCGTILSSLLHTLVICLDRLNATFTTKKKILNILTGNVSVGLCFAIPHVYALARFGLNIWIYGIISCDQQYTTKTNFLLSHDLPVVLLIVAIAGVYGVVARRMIKQQRSVGVHGTTLTETQLEQQRTRALRMLKNVATLGMITSIAAISAFPRSVIGLYVNITGDKDNAAPYARVFIVLMLLTPLLDPIIYLFRIKKYREQLVCKCCRSNAVADSNE